MTERVFWRMVPCRNGCGAQVPKYTSVRAGEQSEGSGGRRAGSGPYPMCDPCRQKRRAERYERFAVRAGLKKGRIERVCPVCERKHKRHGRAVVCSDRCQYLLRLGMTEEERFASLLAARIANRKFRKDESLRERVMREGDLTAAEVRELWDQTEPDCVLCGHEMTKERGPRQAQLDHVIPIAAGGSHTLSNVRFICALCNLERPKNGRDLVILR